MKKLVVERDKLKHNIDIIKKMAHPDVTLIAVLKGNGYGLGVLQYAGILLDNGIDFFAVSEVEEALYLRNNGFENKILLLSATRVESEIEQVVEHDIIPAVGSEECAIMINNIAKKLDKVVDVHLKIDTGFGRFGFLPYQLEKAAALFQSLEHIHITGTFSHLSFSFAKKEKIVREQFDRFLKSIEMLKQNGIEPGMLHIANSCAFLRFQSMHLDAVRIGSAFLGRVPIENKYGFNRVAYLKSNIIEIKQLPAKHDIGYANTFRTKKDTKIAIIPVGYKDGFGVEKSRDTFRLRDILRYIYHDLKLFMGSKSLFVKIKGKKAKILGRVSMYNIIADVTDMDVRVEDEVFLEVNPILMESSIEREYV